MLMPVTLVKFCTKFMDCNSIEIKVSVFVTDFDVLKVRVGMKYHCDNSMKTKKIIRYGATRCQGISL